MTTETDWLPKLLSDYQYLRGTLQVIARADESYARLVSLAQSGLDETKPGSDYAALAADREPAP